MDAAVDGPLDFDQAKSFKAYMAQYGPLDGSQFSSLSFLLKSIDLDPAVINVTWAAYMLATVKHECADTWQPIKEFGKGAGHQYGNAMQVRGSNGELYSDAYYGRGYVQLTWQDNYRRLSTALGMSGQLVIHPEKAMVPEIAYKILSLCLVGGYSANNKQIMNYTLGERPDYKGARHMVNGTDKDVAIADHAVHLEAMFRVSLS